MQQIVVSNGKDEKRDLFTSYVIHNGMVSFPVCPHFPLIYHPKVLMCKVLISFLVCFFSHSVAAYIYVFVVSIGQT